MKDKLIAATLACSLVFGSIFYLVDDDVTPDNFPVAVSEIFLDDDDGIIFDEEAAVILQKIDDMVQNINENCDNFEVQTQEALKELRSLFLFINKDTDDIHQEVIVVDGKSKQQLDTAAKSLSDKMIEICN